LGGICRGKKTLQKVQNFGGAKLSTGSAAAGWNKTNLILEPGATQLVKPGSAYLQASAGCRGINGSFVEISECFSNKISGQTVGDLFFSSQQP
jgi:hypothetical protein